MDKLKFLQRLRKLVHVALIIFWLISLGLNLAAALAFPGLDWRHRLIGISGGFSTLAFLGLYVLQTLALDLLSKSASAREFENAGKVTSDLVGELVDARPFEIGEPPGGIDPETRTALDEDWRWATGKTET